MDNLTFFCIITDISNKSGNFLVTLEIIEACEIDKLIA